jgi:hypothetical protein
MTCRSAVRVEGSDFWKGLSLGWKRWAFSGISIERTCFSIIGMVTIFHVPINFELFVEKLRIPDECFWRSQPCGASLPSSRILAHLNCEISSATFQVVSLRSCVQAGIS